MNNDNDEPIPTARALAEEYVRLGGDPAALNDDLPRLYARIHEDARDGKPRTALAISGGGIRSATFALGIIQELARKGLLQTFDFLSTVSGGGYIGGWLSSFVRRRAGGIQEVAEELAKKPSAPTDPEVKPLRHLREYSNYLTPKLGLMSGDTWSMAANYVRNLLLNWLMLVPLLIAVVILPRLLLGFIREFPVISDSSYHIVLSVIGVLLFIAIAYLGFTRPVETSAEEREEPPWILTNGAFQTLALVPFVLAAMGFAFLWPHSADHDFTPFGVALAAASILGSVVYAVRYSIATRTQRREDVRAESSDAWFTLKKLVLETAVAFASAIAAAAVLWGFFAKVFPPPLPIPFPYPDPTLWVGYPPNLPLLTAEFYVSLAVPVVLIVYFLQAALFVGFTSWFGEDYDREWWARAAGWVFSAAFVWVVFSALTLFGPILIYEFPRIAASIGTITGAYAVLGGKSSKSGGPKSEEKSGKASGFTLSLGVIGTIFAIVVIAAISLGISEVLLRRHDEYKKIGPDEKRYANSTYEVVGTKPVTVKAPGETLPGTLKLATGKYPALDLDRYHAFLHLWIVDHAEAKECLVIFLGCLIVAIVSSWFIGVNRFSMHAFYRNRLVRAYLGASRETRTPNPFTGFDPNDNFAMHKLRAEVFWYRSFTNIQGFITLLRKPAPGTLEAYIASRLSNRTKRLIPGYAPNSRTGQLACESLFDDLNGILDNDDLSKKAPAVCVDPLRSVKNREILDKAYAPTYIRPCGSGRPFHIINTTLNLVAGKELAWQERKGEAFSVTPLHSGSGNPNLGYRDSRLYGGPGGITIGTAVAISGAAASPNMGYNSSPSLSFLMTLFNVRLGWWLGNPGKAGESTYRRRDPAIGIRPIVDEMLGLTDEDHPYVYLSDGGHFEDLALYELVRRRCHCIVVSDAGSDAEFGFDDLGNAVRKIRIDMGIDITFDKIGLFPRSETNPKNPKYCAVGTIHYDRVDANAVNGCLLYIKPAFYGERETRDVYNYAVTHNAFPHETTADQFFSESQFESYRALGEMTIREMTEKYLNPLANACDLIEAARQYVSRKDDEPATAVDEQCDYQRQLKPTETRRSSTPV